MNTRHVSSFLSWHHGSLHTAVKTHALENWKWLPGVEFSIPSGWSLIITQGSSRQGCFFDSMLKIYSLRMIWTRALVWKLEAGLGTAILSCWVSEVWRYFGCPDSHSVICNFCCCNLCKNALDQGFASRKYLLERLNKTWRCLCIDVLLDSFLQESIQFDQKVLPVARIAKQHNYMMPAPKKHCGQQTARGIMAPQAECNLESEMMISMASSLHVGICWVYSACAIHSALLFLWKQCENPEVQQVNQSCEHHSSSLGFVAHMKPYVYNRPCLFIKKHHDQPVMDLSCRAWIYRFCWTQSGPMLLVDAGKHSDSASHQSTDGHKILQEHLTGQLEIFHEESERGKVHPYIHPLHICKISKEFLRVRNL